MGKNSHATECATGCGDLCYYGAVICLECEAINQLMDATKGDSQ
jgi:hypothetical protein